MLRRFDPRIVWGLFLLAAGVLTLLQNLGVLPTGASLLWAVLSGAGGLFFLYVYVSDRANWWALIPGAILSCIAAAVGLAVTGLELAERWAGPLILGGVGLAFWAVYLARREHWWAIIPGGVMATLAVVAMTDTVFQRMDRRIETGGIFFIGLGLTFALVGLAPAPQRMRWAFIPALVLLVMGLLIFAAAEQWLGFLWPAALILAGLYLVLRTLRPRTSG
jgi:hypothetical protein